VRRDDPEVMVRFGGAELTITAPRINGDAGYLVVRSAAVSLTPADSMANGVLSAVVRKATYLGSHWEYTLEAPVGALFVTQPVGKRFETGASVALHLDPQHLSVVGRS
jgi:iron(III) transport system ATP-binding protein